MKKLSFSLLMITLFALFFIMSIKLTSPKVYANESVVSEAFQGMEKILNLTVEEELLEINAQFHHLPAHPSSEKIKELFEEKRVAMWSGGLSDFLGLTEILFEELTKEQQETIRHQYLSYLQVLNGFRKEITSYVLSIHPGLSILKIDSLRSQFKGKGIRVSVFDVFDLTLLEHQRSLYPGAKIHAPLTFGSPVSMTHGNNVIDALLNVAPEIEIIPVWADAKSYTTAMEAIARDLHIDIINMSRALPMDPATKHLDIQFKNALRLLTKEKIFVKSLGNTGTDLVGNLSRRRIEAGLGPVNNLSSYDLQLIRELYQDDGDGDGEREGREENRMRMELLALNLSLFAEDVALTATIPGTLNSVQLSTIGIPAEGIYGQSTGTFESGSSFAAPQLTGILALLLEERLQTQRLSTIERESHNRESRIHNRLFAYTKLRSMTTLFSHLASEWGLGIPQGR